MSPFQFITLRYRPDALSGEFANIGVVVYSEGIFLGARFNSRISRLKCFFQHIEREHFKSIVKDIDSRFKKLAAHKDVPIVGEKVTAETLAHATWPQDDSALHWSTMKSGLAPDCSAELDRLFERLVTRYEKAPATIRRDDKDVWASYKAAFKGTRILDHLEPVELEAPDYSWEFEHTFQNGVCHILQPVALDYQERSDVIEKGSKWLGRGAALRNSSTKHSFNFLLGESDDTSKTAVTKVENLLHKIGPNVTIVHEHERESYAGELDALISEHLS